MNPLLKHTLLRIQSSQLFWWKAGLLPMSHAWVMVTNHPHNHIGRVSVKHEEYDVAYIEGKYAHSRYPICTKPWPESNDSFIFEI